MIEELANWPPSAIKSCHVSFKHSSQYLFLWVWKLYSSTINNNPVCMDSKQPDWPAASCCTGAHSAVWWRSWRRKHSPPLKPPSSQKLSLKIAMWSSPVWLQVLHLSHCVVTLLRLDVCSYLIEYYRNNKVKNLSNILKRKKLKGRECTKINWLNFHLFSRLLSIWNIFR